MGTGDLPEMYAQGPTANLSIVGIDFRQILSISVTTNVV